uniref:Solute carrier organic anion transporter family member n=1 Tax=Phallusia mammillata TaxID=59560 RepID=A0A6F9DTL5_9ASCI|nr:solute carrier organic anion transporter family member 2A1-like [Phallusia mammillata]
MSAPSKKALQDNKTCQVRSIRGFVFFAGIVMCGQMSLAIYSKSVLTNIEKRFEISSSLAGFIVGSFNIGNLLFVVAVSKLSSKRHRPRIMALGSLLIAVGGFVNAIPHFVTSPYQPSLLNETQSMTDCPGTNNNGTTTYVDNGVGSHLFLVLILGEILQGIGATVHIPVSSSYIDDFALPSRSPIYLGISFVFQNIGPGIGYVIGSWTSNIYVDFDRVPAENVTITSEDKTVWIGAWWLGYLVIGTWVALAALPLLLFPKRLPKEVDSDCDPDCDDSDSVEMRPLENGGSIESKEHGKGSDEDTSFPLVSGDASSKNPTQTQNEIGFWQDFVTTVVRLLSNAPYVMVICGYSGIMFVTGALTAFMPKLLEQAFDKSSADANFLFGIVIPPVMCIGLLSGGIIVNRLKWTKDEILRFIVICGVVALIPIVAVYFISCTPVDPDCKNMNFTLGAMDGPTQVINCQSDCDSMTVVFVIVTSIAALIAANMVTPIYTVVLRSVAAEDKCTAIGVMFLVIRVLGLVPAPIVTGAVIDSTCLQWKQECGDATKNCIAYDVNRFRLSFITILLLGIFVCLLFNFFAYVIVRRKNRTDSGSGSLCSALHACRCYFRNWRGNSESNGEVHV